MAPKFVAPYRMQGKCGKNDANDAAAICEAVTRPSMRAFAEAWPDGDFVQQAAAQLPWFHICTLLDKLKGREEREWYAARALEHGWSRNILVMQIETRLLQRQGAAATNFAMRLPPPQSEMAQATLKDPYIFDFLGLADDAHERDIEQGWSRTRPNSCSSSAPASRSSAASTGSTSAATSFISTCCSTT